MTSDIATARSLLAGNVTCAFVKGNKTFVRTERGVAPLLALIDSGEDYGGFSAADKVVGKAAAMLYVRLGIKELYAGVLGVTGAEVLYRHGIRYDYGTLTDRIINRAGDGYCPMELAVENVSDAEEGERKIRARSKELRD